MDRAGKRRSVVGLVVFVGALCGALLAPAAVRAQPRDVRVHRLHFPAEFFKQEVVRFERTRIDMNGLIYADSQKIDLYGIVLIGRTRICISPERGRWACGRRAFLALRNLLDKKPIACRFMHDTTPPKAACSVEDNDVAQYLLTHGWAELAEGVTDEVYVEAQSSAQAAKVGIWADGPP